MKTKQWLISAIGALALGGAAALPAQAAPATAAIQLGLGPAAAVDTGVEQVRDRCYRRHGRWFCSKRRHFYHYGPGIRLYFGPSRHWGSHRGNWRHHHGRRHHRHHR